MTSIAINQTKKSLWNETIQLVVDVYNSVKITRSRSSKAELRRVSLNISSSVFNGLNQPYGKEYLNYLAKANGCCTELELLIHQAVSSSSIDKISAVRILRKLKEVSSQLFRLAVIYHN